MRRLSTQFDIVAFLGLGFSILLGGLQMSPCSGLTPYFVGLGLLIVGVAIVYYLYGLQHAALTRCWKILVGLIVSTVIFTVASILFHQAYVSSHAGEYITAYERNGELWGHAPAKPIRLGPDTTLRMKQQDSFAELRLVVGNSTLDDTISPDSDIVATIPTLGGQVRFGNKYPGIWNPLDSITPQAQRFWAKIPDSIWPNGRSAKGPDEPLKVQFPVGKHRIDYTIQGETVKHCAFSFSSYYSIEVY